MTDSFLDTLLPQLASGAAHTHALGFAFAGLDGDRVRIRVPYREDLVGDPETGVLAGGLVTTLLDHVGGLAVWWGLSTGRLILAVFLGIAVISHLKRGVWRAAWGRLSWPEAGRSLALYLATAAVCAAAAIGALLPLTGGAVEPAFDMGLRFIGVGGR